MDDKPYGDHLEPAVLHVTISTQLCGKETEILPLQWRLRQAVSLVALQQQRPSSVSWELAAGPVQCSDRRRVSLEPAVQSRTEMLPKSAMKIYLMPRNLCRPHTPPKGPEGDQGTCLSSVASNRAVE